MGAVAFCIKIKKFFVLEDDLRKEEEWGQPQKYRRLKKMKLLQIENNSVNEDDPQKEDHPKIDIDLFVW